MTNDIEPNCAGDVGVHPDPSASLPLEPRSTADFINAVWDSRKAPVYALRTKELAILTSKTARGWFWRLVLRLLRYHRTPKWCVVDEADDCYTVAITTYAWGHPLSSEHTMEHYLALASKFTPELSAIKQSVYPGACDCTEFHQDRLQKPRKHTGKKTHKRKSRTPK